MQSGLHALLLPETLKQYQLVKNAAVRVRNSALRCVICSENALLFNDCVSVTTMLLMRTLLPLFWLSKGMRLSLEPSEAVEHLRIRQQNGQCETNAHSDVTR